MRAIAKTQAKPGLEIISAPKPQIARDQVLIQVKASSICGSDVHLYQWDEWAQQNVKPPQIIGHECAGEVVAIGPEVEHIKIGDRVAVEDHVPCQKCARCRNGEMHICTNLKNIGFNLDGGFAEYIVVPEICCIKLHEGISWKIAPVLEPLGNSVYAVSESQVTGKSVVIYGDGPTGLFAAAVARQYGAKKIFAVGLSPYRLQIMKQLGPDFVLNAKEHPVAEIVRQETEGEGADIVLEMSGAPAAIQEGFRVLRNGGTFTAFGIPKAPLEIDFSKNIILKGIKVLGIHGRKMFETWTRTLALFENPHFNISPVITHELPLEKANEAMELLTSKTIEAGKILLIP